MARITLRGDRRVTLKDYAPSAHSAARTSVRPLAKLGPMPAQEASQGVVIARHRSARRWRAWGSCQREQRSFWVTPHYDYLPQPRAAEGEHGFGGGRRRAAREASEHRRVPTPRFVEQRGGSCGERGIRTLVGF